MVYEIFDDDGQVVNRIVADENFVKAHHPERYRLCDTPNGGPPAEGELPSPQPTKEDLLAQLQALQAQITALGGE